MIRHDILRWAGLPAAERERIGAESIVLLQRVFAGLSPEGAAGFVANFEWVHTLRTEDGALVGLDTVRFIQVQPTGTPRPVWVLNHFAGILPEHRGGNTVLRFLLRVGFAHWFRTGMRTFYYCCRFIHPSPYRLFVRFGSRPYPHPDAPARPELDALIGAIGEALGYPLEPNPHGHFVTRPAFRVAAEKPEALQAFAADPITRYFTEQAPRYREGQGLLVLMPLGWRAAVEAPLRIAWGQLRRRR